jgi:hypothetical protein
MLQATIIKDDNEQVIHKAKTLAGLEGKLKKAGIVISQFDLVFLQLKSGYTQSGTVKVKIENK